jgi:hypothetical protein
MEIEAKMPINGLLESTGRRMMLLGRLIDEYSIPRPANKTENSSTIEFRNTKQWVKAESQTPIAAVEQNSP